jgi:hypothetical protein
MSWVNLFHGAGSADLADLLGGPQMLSVIWMQL